MLYYVIVCVFCFSLFRIFNIASTRLSTHYDIIDEMFETIRISRAENLDFCVNYYFWKKSKYRIFFLLNILGNELLLFMEISFRIIFR